MTTYQTQGTTIARGDGDSPEEFDPITQVSSISGVGSSRNPIETTNLSSTGREYQLSIKDGGEIALGIQYDPADETHTGLKTDHDSNVLRNFRVTLANDSPAEVWSFAARVQNYELGEMSPDGVQMLNVVLRVSGDYSVA